MSLMLSSYRNAMLLQLLREILCWLAGVMADGAQLMTPTIEEFAKQVSELHGCLN